jgi:hypothetical protein
MTLEEIKAMPAAVVAEHLVEHNKWRRGEGKYEKIYSGMPYSAQVVGALIDRAVEILKSVALSYHQEKLKERYGE